MISSMDHFFIFSSSHPPFSAFRDEIFLQTMNGGAGENELKPLTIPHLKICLNSECNTFKEATHKAVIDHYEEASLNQFFQFAHDGATLLNKDKCQDFGMKFADTTFRHNDAI